MIPSNLDPTHYTALHSLTFGDALSSDGRAHPVDANMPVSVTQQNAPVVAVDHTTPTAGAATGMDCSMWPIGSPGWIACKAQGVQVPSIFPSHFGARVAVGFIGVALVIIVAWSILKP
jgi:hypothetical protein